MRIKQVRACHYKLPAEQRTKRMRPIADMLLAVLLGTLVAVMCLTPDSATAAIVKQGSIVAQGQTRTYSVYLPAGMNSSRRYPIVMMLHGGTQNGDRVAMQTGLGNYVDQGGFIAVFPNSIGRQWNDGREAMQSNVDDVGFLVALVRDLVATAGGDPAHVFVGGVSNGGMMTQRLACEATNVFAAYASVDANMPSRLVGICHPSRRAPIVIIESTTDPLMPWAGGEIKHGPGGVGGTVLSTPDTVNLWSKLNGCGPAQGQNLPIRVNDGTSATEYDFGSCGLLFYEIHGGGHTWPGSKSPIGFLGRLIVGKTSESIDATATILNFFRRYGL
jgi:polyhydroxybutyrate depolymerase